MMIKESKSRFWLCCVTAKWKKCEPSNESMWGGHAFTMEKLGLHDVSIS